MRMKGILGKWTLCAFALTSVLFGAEVFAGGTTEAATGAGVVRGVTLPLKEKVELTWFMAENVPFNKEWLTYSELQKKTGVTFKYQLVSWNELSEKVNVLLASGDLPDLAYGVGNFKKNGKDGLLLNFKPYMDKGLMPNYRKWADKFPEWYKVVPDDNGDVYVASTFFAGEYTMPMSLVVRGDILEKNSIPMPKTWAEMYGVYKKVKQLYPDSWPMGDQAYPRLMTHIAPAWDTDLGIYYREKDKAWRYGPIEPNFKEFIQYMSKLYSEQLLDPEFALKSENVFWEKYFNGKVFSAVLWWQINATRSLEGQKKVPGFKMVTVMPILKVDGKDSKLPAWNVALGEGLVSSARTKYPDIVAAVQDYFYSDEAIELFNWGVEGITFTRDGKGGRVFKPEIKSARNTAGTKDKEIDFGVWNTSSALPKMQLQFVDTPNMDEFTASETAGMSGLFKTFGRLPEPKPLFNKDEEDTVASKMTAVNTYYSENILKFIKGESKMSEWDGFVSALKKMGADQVLEIYSKYVKK